VNTTLVPPKLGPFFTHITEWATLETHSEFWGDVSLIESTYARAHALQAETYLIAYQFPFDAYYLNPKALDIAQGSVSRALQFDPQSPFAHAMAGRVLGFMHQYEESIAEFEGRGS
jgi:hypothetical protein